MPHSLDSCGSGSPLPPPAWSNGHTSSRFGGSEDTSHLPRPTYSPQQNGEGQQPSQPIMGYRSTADGISVGSNNPPNYNPEVAQPSIAQNSDYVHQPQSSQFYHQAQSNTSVPWTPAPTTSDVHNRDSRSNSISSTTLSSSSGLQQQPLVFAYPHMLSRFFTINPADSPLAYEDRRAISEGLVQEGDDMFAIRSGEQGWMLSDHNIDYDERESRKESGGSRTLGRSRDGATQ